NGYRKHGDFAPLTGSWIMEGEFESNQRTTPAKIVVGEETEAPNKRTRTVVRLTLGDITFGLDPLKADQTPADLKEPPQSGGFLMALYQYRRLLTLGEKGFEQHFSPGGTEPFYPPRLDGAAPANLADLRADTEVLLTEHAAIPIKWYFSPKDQRLLGFETTVIK